MNFNSKTKKKEILKERKTRNLLRKKKKKQDAFNSSTFNYATFTYEYIANYMDILLKHYMAKFIFSNYNFMRK